MAQRAAMSKTVEVQLFQDRSIEAAMVNADEDMNPAAEVLETKMEELGSRRGHSKNIHLI